MQLSPEDLFTRRYNELQKNRGTKDYYETIKNSAILRQLLIDSTPLINIVNRSLKCKIRFEVDDTIQKAKAKLKVKILYLGKERDNLHIRFSERLKSLNLSQFLSLEILEIKDEKFTVREIIKYASNKKGGVHYDDPGSMHEDKLNELMIEIERNSLSLLSAVLNNICDIVLVALRPLKNKLAVIPDDSCFLALFTLPEDKAIFFEGKQQLTTEEMNFSITEGFAYFARVKIIHQKFNGKRFLYHIGNTTFKGFDFSVYITKNRGLGCQVKLNSKNTLKIESLDIRQSSSFNVFINLACVFSFESGISKLEMYIDNQLVAKKEGTYKKIDRNLDKQVIGGDLDKKRNASFYIRELGLLKVVNDDIINCTNLYFDRKFSC